MEGEREGGREGGREVKEEGIGGRVESRRDIHSHHTHRRGIDCETKASTQHEHEREGEGGR